MLVPLGSGLDPGEGAVIEVDFTLEPTRALRSSLHEGLSHSDGLLRVSDWFPVVSDGHGLRMPGDSQVTAAADRITVDLRLDRRLDVAAPGAVAAPRAATPLRTRSATRATSRSPSRRASRRSRPGPTTASASRS